VWLVARTADWAVIAGRDAWIYANLDHARCDALRLGNSLGLRVCYKQREGQ
jgi:hypothetical protein